MFLLLQNYALHVVRAEQIGDQRAELRAVQQVFNENPGERGCGSVNELSRRHFPEICCLYMKNAAGECRSQTHSHQQESFWDILLQFYKWGWQEEFWKTGGCEQHLHSHIQKSSGKFPDFSACLKDAHWDAGYFN